MLAKDRRSDTTSRGTIRSGATCAAIPHGFVRKGRRCSLASWRAGERSSTDTSLVHLQRLSTSESVRRNRTSNRRLILAALIATVARVTEDCPSIRIC